MRTKGIPRGFVSLRIAGGSGEVSIPSPMMKSLKVGMVFRPEFTEEGILLRFVSEVPATDVEPPEWAK